MLAIANFELSKQHGDAGEYGKTVARLRKAGRLMAEVKSNKWLNNCKELSPVIDAFTSVCIAKCLTIAIKLCIRGSRK